MSRIWTITRREWLEQVRQPVMIAVIGATFAILAGLPIAALLLLDHLAEAPEQAVFLTQLAGGSPGSALDELAVSVVTMANWLLYTQFLGISAVLAGHSILHDRERHTLPFLLLAPITRPQLLVGKVLGAVGPSLAIYLGVSTIAFLAMTSVPIAQAAAIRLPPSPAWAVSFYLGGPIWAVALATLCALISSASRDVRTAQQAVWFSVLFASFLCGYLLTIRIDDGPVVQLAIAGAGALCAATALLGGSELISRNLR